MPWLTDPRTWASLATLVVLETVLGVDNLVFLALLTGRPAGGPPCHGPGAPGSDWR